MNNRWSLKNKKALITGATKGIGKAIAEEFAAFDADIFIIARNKKDIEKMIKDYKNVGSAVDGISMDVTDRKDREKLFKVIEKKWGKLDIIVNNAGFNNRKKTLEYTDSLYDEVIDLNMKSVFEMCRLFHPLLKKSGNASIVNIKLCRRIYICSFRFCLCYEQSCNYPIDKIPVC